MRTLKNVSAVNAMVPVELLFQAKQLWKSILMPQKSNQALFKPRRVAVKLHGSLLAQFVYLWSTYERPTDFKVQRSEKSPEFIGVIFNVENDATLDMMTDIKNELRAQIVDL